MDKVTEITHRGDYLTFAALGVSVGLPYEVSECEREPGVYTRHWLPFDSRSSVSRDGYLGVLHWAVSTGDIDRVNRIIKAGWGRRWNMGEGNWDYVNMSPLIPTLYAIKWGIPRLSGLIPLVALPKLRRGYRAHLLAISVLLQLRLGYKSWISQWSMGKLVESNPSNPLFNLIYNKMSGRVYNYDTIMSKFENKIGCHGWGSCEPAVFRALCNWIHINL